VPGLDVFREGGARPPSGVNVAFIDDRRDEFGVEPICAVLPIAPGQVGAAGRDRHRTPVVSVGDTYDNAMAESVMGLFRAKAIHSLGPCKGLDEGDFATLHGARGSATSAGWSRAGTFRLSTQRRRTIIVRQHRAKWRACVRSSPENPARFRPGGTGTLARKTLRRGGEDHHDPHDL